MKYLNLQAFREALVEASESLAETARAARWRAQDAHDDLEQCRASGEADESSTALRAYQRVLELLDEHTFDLGNSWGRYACYMDGDDPPTPPCNHLSAKAQLLGGPGDHIVPPQNRVRLLALLTLATVHCFDTWMDEKQAEYGLFGLEDDGEVSSATKVFHEVWGMFTTLFGRPGFLQDVPDWVRQSFAWSYPATDEAELKLEATCRTFPGRNWTWREPGPIEEDHHGQ